MRSDIEELLKRLNEIDMKAAGAGSAKIHQEIIQLSQWMQREVHNEKINRLEVVYLQDILKHLNESLDQFINKALAEKALEKEIFELRQHLQIKVEMEKLEKNFKKVNSPQSNFSIDNAEPKKWLQAFGDLFKAIGNPQGNNVQNAFQSIIGVFSGLLMGLLGNIFQGFLGQSGGNELDFQQNTHQNNDDLAIASGLGNNCGLHVIAHHMLALPTQTLRALYQDDTKPVYKQIIDTFYRHYELPGEPNINGFLHVANQLKHPYDREVLLGPVLRKVLQDIVPAKEKSNVAGNLPIHDDLMGELAKSMGLSLTVHNTVEFQDTQRFVTYKPQAGKIACDIQAYHVGNHYNFSFPTRAENVAHNHQMRHLNSAHLAATAYNKKATKTKVQALFAKPQPRPRFGSDFVRENDLAARSSIQGNTPSSINPDQLPSMKRR